MVPRTVVWHSLQPVSSMYFSTHSRLVVVALRGEVLLVGVLNLVQTLNLGPPLLAQSSNFLSVSLVGVVADLSQLLADCGQSLVCVSNRPE